MFMPAKKHNWNFLMKHRSNTNVVRCSDGTTMTSAQYERKVRAACRERMERQKADCGYNFCNVCGVNDRYAIIDPSHDVSVKECREAGQAEKAINPDFITPRCRDCHRKHDKLNLRWTS